MTSRLGAAAGLCWLMVCSGVSYDADGHVKQHASGWAEQGQRSSPALLAGRRLRQSDEREAHRRNGMGQSVLLQRKVTVSWDAHLCQVQLVRAREQILGGPAIEPATGIHARTRPVEGELSVLSVPLAAVDRA